MAELDGVEVLVVDGDVEVQRGLAQALTELGVQPTVLGLPERARALVREKYFSVVILDIDTPTPSGGLELCRTVVAESPTTAVLMLTARRVYEAAVDAFRAGATDIVVKAPDQVAYLQRRVVEATKRARQLAHDDQLVGDALAVHEEFLKRLMETSRRVAELDEKIGGGAQSHGHNAECAVLLVEGPERDWLTKRLTALLAKRSGYSLRTAGSGGEGLDLAGSTRFAIALVCDTLPDLPGSMVVSAFKGQSPETITVLYSLPGAHPASQPGRADIVDGGRAIPLLAKFTEAAELLDRLDELREAALRTSRERRYLATFREENYELLRRYAALRQRLDRARKH